MACMSISWATTWQCRPSDSVFGAARAIADARSWLRNLETGVQPHLFQPDGFVVGPNLSARPVCSPAGTGKEPPKLVVGRIHPAGCADEAVGPERVGAGIQEPGSMSLVLGGRVDHELIDSTFGTPVGIVVLVRHGGGKPDDSARAVGCDKNPETGFRWSLDGRAPGFHHLSQRH
jgi:hypothetical protein